MSPGEGFGVGNVSGGIRWQLQRRTSFDEINLQESRLAAVPGISVRVLGVAK